MNFEKYKNYTTRDFLEDHVFRQWVLNPGKKSQAQWQTLFEKYPLQETKAREARRILLEMQRLLGLQDQIDLPLDESFRHTLSEVMEQSLQSGKTPKTRTLMLMRWAAAASILIVLGLFLWSWLRTADDTLVFSTNYGEWQTVELPDGSTVQLNANTTLRLAKQWKPGLDRTVWLKGEAFFTIQKKPHTGAKFLVKTDDLVVEVLGTAFNVHSRGDETKVFLEEGSISLDLGYAQEQLQPGEFLAYSAKKKSITDRRTTTPQSQISWKDGTIILENRPTREILQKIEELYGVDFNINDPEILEKEKTIMIPMDKWEITRPILEKVYETSIQSEGGRLIFENK